MVKTSCLNIVLWVLITSDFAHPWQLEAIDVSVTIGDNVTLPCSYDKLVSESDQVMWVKEDRSERLSHFFIQADGSLNLPNVARYDSGLYMCSLEVKDSHKDTESLTGHDLTEDEASIKARYRLTVKAIPGELANVSVHPSTVLALLLWEVADTGGCEISYFNARYRQVHSQDWLDVVPRQISPNTRQIDVYHLTPNSTYTFQIWAVNEVGTGDKVSVEATTKHVIQEIELARHLLQGVETFDTRVWVAAVAVVMGTLLVLSIGTCYLMFRDHHTTVWSADDHEIMELVPNIILNPGFLDDPDRVAPDENCNDQLHVAFNNNSIVRPMRV